MAPILHVVCAIIINNRQELLLAQRASNMEHSGQWEFPGGKIKQNETDEEALIREIKEELDVYVSVKQPLKEVKWTYVNKQIILKPFLCRIESGIPSPLEHNALNWFPLSDLDSIDLVEADVEIVKELKGLK